MSERKWYVRCETGCIAESMTKEQIMTAIESAISTGEIGDVDTGFITRIKEQNSGAGLSFWVGTSAEYNALDPKINNCFYIITDDTTTEDIEAAIEKLKKQIEPIETKINGFNSVLWEGTATPFDVTQDQPTYYDCENIGNYSLFLVETGHTNPAAASWCVLCCKDENNFAYGSLIAPNGTIFKAGLNISGKRFYCETAAVGDENGVIRKIIGIM